MLKMVLEHIAMTYKLISDPKEALENNREYLKKAPVPPDKWGVAAGFNYQCYKEYSRE